jgi:hypothetical protein
MVKDFDRKWERPKSMRTNIYWLDDSPSGRIGIMPRPRGGDWLEDEIRALRDAGVDVIVSLLEKHEIEELDLQHEPVYCNANDIICEVSATRLAETSRFCSVVIVS